MICHAQHSMLNHFYTLWFSVVILFGICLIAGLLRAGGQIQTLSNKQKTSKAKWEPHKFCCLAEKWDVTKRRGSWKLQEMFWKKHFESLFCYCCFHLSDFILCITKSPADCFIAWGFVLVLPTRNVSTLQVCRTSQTLARVGSGLSEYPANRNRTAVTQICSVLRGQVPFPYRNLTVNMAGVFAIIPSETAIQTNAKCKIQAKVLTQALLTAGMDGHPCDLPPALTARRYSEVGRYSCWLQFSTRADLGAAASDLIYKGEAIIPLTSAESLSVS